MAEPVEAHAEPSVLIVAYEQHNFSALSRILRKVNIPSTLARTLDEARIEIAKGVHEVVMTDWTRVDGEEVVKAAKAQSGIRQIIVLNGGGQDVIERANAMGVSTMEKPFPDAATIIEAVRGNLSTVKNYFMVIPPPSL